MVAPLYDSSMRVLISGASGFIGTALTQKLLERGDEVIHLVRRDPVHKDSIREVRWDPTDPSSVDPHDLRGIDAAFNFSGATVSKRWTRRYKQVIADTRIGSVRTLNSIFAGMANPPGTVITASGLGIYGDRGDEQLTERSRPGVGYLAEVAVPWELATAEAGELGCRTLTARFAVVMGASGGPLSNLVRPFRLGLGGRLGDGRQWSPWVHIDDAARALLFMADNESLDGPVIVASPGVVRNSELSKAIAEAIGKPAPFWMPAIVARAVLGQMIQELGLASVLAIPEKLMKAGFEFENRDLRGCLKQELGGSAN